MKAYLPLVVAACLFTMVSCTKDQDNSAAVSDATLSSMTTSSDGLTLMRTSDRAEGKWVIKMNDVAARAVANGNAEYPSNAMLVKEKHDQSGTLIGYDVMYRAPSDPNAHDGWVFSQLDGNGEPMVGGSEKMAACQSCHSVDFTPKKLH